MRELALLHFLCKQPSEKGQLILIFGAIPPPRNFAKIRTRGGRGLLPVQPKDSIPPWGHTGARRARRGRFAPESSGRRRGKMAAPSAACVGFQATSAIEAAGGRKSPFLPYKEALFFRARLLSNQSCFTPESLSFRSGCFFGGAE